MGKRYLTTVTNYGSALDTDIESIRAQFQTGAEGVVLDGIYTARNSYKQVHGSFLSYLQSIMQNTVIEQANDSSALSSKTLSNALSALISQMKANSDSVLAPTTSATVTAYSGNKGDGQLHLSFTNPYGDAVTTPYPETIRFLCTSDSTNYAETFSITGQPQKSFSDQDWPGGSGASGSISLFNAATDGIIKNGNFATWSSPSAAPDSWVIETGAAGTTVVRDTTTKRGTGYAMEFASDGSTLISVKQQLSSSAIAANNVIALNLWAKVSAADASGIMRFRLVDGGGTVITNDAGNNLSFTKDTNTAIGTSFTNISGFFQLPRQLPSTGVFLQVTMSTATAAGKNVFLSLIGVTKAQSLYSGGPYAAAFSSASAHSAGDYFDCAVANNAANASWVRAGQRFLNMPALGDKMYFPSVTSSPTVSDSLLT